jgi:hypothetical protein
MDDTGPDDASELARISKLLGSVELLGPVEITSRATGSFPLPSSNRLKLKRPSKGDCAKFARIPSGGGKVGYGDSAGGGELLPASIMLVLGTMHFLVPFCDSLTTERAFLMILGAEGKR